MGREPLDTSPTDLSAALSMYDRAAGRADELADRLVAALAEIDRLTAALADANRLIDELTDEARDRDAVPTDAD